jgi:glycerophosphoryl diester phosphodiesterase
VQSMCHDPASVERTGGHRDVIVVGHRGASGTAPENTLAAIAEAARQGAEYAEVDVVLSADGVPVLAHDTTLQRTTDVAKVFPDRATWTVGEFTLAELRALDAGGWFDDRYAGQRLPTLREALRVSRQAGIGLWLELKSPTVTTRLAQTTLARAVADVLRTAPDGWLIAPDRARWVKATSFNWQVLADFAAAIEDALPVGGITEWVPDDATLHELAGWMEFLIPNYRRLRPGDVSRIRAAGLRTGFWTPNDPEAVRALLAQGADALIQNYPAVARAIVAGRPALTRSAGVVVERVGIDGVGVAGATGDPGGAGGGGEYVVLRNVSADPVDVGNWYLRDDPGYRLWIGPGYSIPAGGTLSVHVGSGPNGPSRYYNGLTTTMFSKGGDSVALHRPDGTLVDLAGNDLGDLS